MESEDGKHRTFMWERRWHTSRGIDRHRIPSAVSRIFVRPLWRGRRVVYMSQTRQTETREKEREDTKQDKDTGPYPVRTTRRRRISSTSTLPKWNVDPSNGCVTATGGQTLLRRRKKNRKITNTYRYQEQDQDQEQDKTKNTIKTEKKTKTKTMTKTKTKNKTQKIILKIEDGKWCRDEETKTRTRTKGQNQQTYRKADVYFQREID